MKKLLSSDRKTIILRIAFSIVILSLIISILPVRPSYADDGNLPEYRLYPGDIRESANRPDIIAYANTEYSMPPPEFTIVTSGTIWRYAQWIALVEKGNFIRATTTIDTTSIGVQFWGDTNDGWARVLVDGSEVWRGSIYGTDSNYPGGAFVKYLEISSLAPRKHTISVENMGINGGGGGDDVTIFFFGLRKAPPAPTPPTSQVLDVDVWTNRGGQGSNISGGTFEVGDTVTIYAKAISSSTGKWSVLGPSMSDSGTQELQGGRTYAWDLGLAEETDIGEWQVKFDVSNDGQYASDTVNFSVIRPSVPAPAPTPTPTPTPAPAPTPTPTPTPQPPTGVEEEGTAKIDAASATELDALIALKMAEGELSADLYMDANGDGKVTREDAELILQWAVQT
jgi:hypothetical protein